MTLKNAFDEFMFQKELAGLSPASLSDYRNYITITAFHVEGDIRTTRLY